MALSTCRECGRQVSTEATSCPHCGVLVPTASSPEILPGAAQPSQSTSGDAHRAVGLVRTRVRRTRRRRVPAVFAIVLIPLVMSILALGLWWSIAPPPILPIPVEPLAPQSGGGSAKDLELFGWQWCQEAPGTANVPAGLAPIEMGVVRAVKHGPLDIRWFWCRPKSSYGLVVVYAQVTNTGTRSISNVLLDFSLYDKNGSLIGNHSLAVQNLDAQGSAKIEDKLPSQYSDWDKWTAWSMKLARINAN
jgi:hypothetical protein